MDVETDAKVQRTIQTEFASSTLLCIAHRLNTIGTLLSYCSHSHEAHAHPRSVYYDRILVMDQGKVAEFDTPLNLIQKEKGTFREMCLKSGTFAELEAAAKAKAEADGPGPAPAS